MTLEDAIFRETLSKTSPHRIDLEGVIIMRQAPRTAFRYHPGVQNAESAQRCWDWKSLERENLGSQTWALRAPHDFHREPSPFWTQRRASLRA